MAKKKNILNKLILILILLVILAIISVGVGLYLKYGPNLGIALGIVEEEKVSSSKTISIESKDLERLYTAEFLWDMVFPHDFFPDETIWNNFLTKKKYNHTLTIEEAKYDQLYTLCRDAGFESVPSGTEFFVLRVIVKAGYDLSSPLAKAIMEGPKGFVRWEEDVLVIDPPEVRILDVRLEDPQRETYPFPDTPLTPNQLKLITGYVSATAENKAIENGLLETAESNGTLFLSRLLEDAEIETVEFR